MDPDANLKRQLELANRMLDSETYKDSRDGDELAQLVLDLHNWLSTGGTFPTEWRLK